jgi:GntR family transcriptional regulator, transcriptional repressor for pyruvate dehydrogenase complex
MRGMSVTDEAISRVKAMISSGELAPGDRLPPEKELAERLGLSRSSMREAVKALEVTRVLDVRRGDGTYVTSLEPARILDAVSFAVDVQDDASLLQILSVRRVLEAYATGIAAQRATEDDVQALRDEVERGADVTDIRSLVDHDLRLHALIAGIAGNAYLSSLLASISSPTVSTRVWHALTEAGLAEHALAEHRGIVDAVASQENALATALATAHGFGVERCLGLAGPAR